MSFREPRTRMVVPMWQVDMDQVISSDEADNRNWLGWLIDHDWQVGAFLCALPVVIVIVIALMLGI